MSAAEALTSRVILVTGASRGIGEVCARAAAAAGAAVVLAARDANALEDVADKIRRDGGAALAVPTDVTDEEQVRRLVNRATAELGGLDGAVNAAGGSEHPPTTLCDVPLDAFDRVLGSTLRGVFISLRHELRALRGRTGGAVVNVASTAALWPVAGLAGYAAAKAGVVALTRVAALDHARDGIRVNGVAPGPIATGPLLNAEREVRDRVARNLPLGRLGTAEEVAGTVVWLLSDASTFITGAVLPVDGGLLAGMPGYGRTGKVAS